MTATSLLVNDVIKSDYNSVRSSVTNMTVEKFMSKVIYDESQLEDSLLGERESE